MLGWLWKKGRARLKTLAELPQIPLQLPQPDGTRVPIALKKVDCPEKKLGIYTCPTGDFSYHVSQLVETGSEYAARLSARHLPARDAWMGTRYQLFPKLINGAAAVTHAPQALKEAYQSIWYKLLPLLRVNRNITKEYRMLPLRFQELALPNPNIEFLSHKIHLLQTNWDTGSTIGKMLHQAYQVFQVEVGLGGNIFAISYVSFQGLATRGDNHKKNTSSVGLTLIFSQNQNRGLAVCLFFFFSKALLGLPTLSKTKPENEKPNLGEEVRSPAHFVHYLPPPFGSDRAIIGSFGIPPRRFWRCSRMGA